MLQTVRFRIDGRVQGVGFRYWTVRQAHSLKLDGSVRNLADGSVEVEACGPRAEVDQLVAACMSGPRHADVIGVTVLEQTAGDPAGLTGRGFQQVR